MSDKDYVLEIIPTAQCIGPLEELGELPFMISRPPHRNIAIGDGATEDEAWHNARIGLQVNLRLAYMITDMETKLREAQERAERAEAVVTAAREVVERYSWVSGASIAEVQQSRQRLIAALEQYDQPTAPTPAAEHEA